MAENTSYSELVEKLDTAVCECEWWMATLVEGDILSEDLEKKDITNIRNGYNHLRSAFLAITGTPWAKTANFTEQDIKAWKLKDLCLE